MKPIHFAFLVFLVTGRYTTQAQESVYIKADQEGVGILRPRAGECFVIAPAHVVEDAINPIGIVGERDVHSVGSNSLLKYEPDLAVVRILEGGQQNCREWKTDQAYDDIAENSFEGFLETRQGNGAVRVMKVLLAGKDGTTITVKPLFREDLLRKGMSGSSLFVQADGKRVFLGMLMEISDQSTGHILKASSMNVILEDFFSYKTGRDPKRKGSIAVSAFKPDGKEADYALAGSAAEVLSQKFPDFIVRRQNSGDSPGDGEIQCIVLQSTVTTPNTLLINGQKFDVIKAGTRLTLIFKDSGRILDQVEVSGSATDHDPAKAVEESITYALEMAGKGKIELPGRNDR